MTGHGGWPMTCVLDHDGNPFFAGTYFPDQPRHGQPRFRQVLEALADAWQTKRATTSRAWPATLREHLAPDDAAMAAARSTPRRWTRAVATLAREFDPAHGGFGGAPEVPAVDGAASSCCRRTADRSPMRVGCVDATCERDGPRRHLRPARRRVRALLRRRAAGWCRTSRRCSTTTRSCSASTPGWATDARAPGRRGDRRLHARASCARPRAASPPRSTPTARASRASSTPGRRPSWSRCSARTTAPWAAPVCSRSPRRAPSSTAPRPCSCAQDPDDLRRGWPTSSAGCSSARDRAGPPGPRRQGGRRLERAGDQRPLRRRAAARRAGVRRAPRSRPASCSWRAARRRRPAAPGLARRRRRRATPGCWRTTAASPPASSPSLQATGDAGLARPRAACCSTTALERFRADDGGFFDTADDAEALVARPRDPVRQRQPVRAVRRWCTRSSTYAALTGDGPPPRGRRGGARDGRDAGRAGAAVRRLVARRGRRRCSTVRVEVAVVGPPGAGRATPSARRARRHPGAVVVVADGPRDDVPLLAGRDAGRRPPGGVRLPRLRLRAAGHHRRGPSGGAYRGVGSAHAG